mmetsp:Transcript_41047/g.80523  ORF Transcript_41047/g.80523 Transcript_41047/m.80523 type:complete len:151 (-) Transcript_41047:38-490(-)
MRISLFLVAVSLIVGSVTAGSCGPTDFIHLNTPFGYSGADCPPLQCFNTTELPVGFYGAAARVLSSHIEGPDDELCVISGPSGPDTRPLNVVCGLSVNQTIAVTGVCHRLPASDVFMWGVCPRSGIVSKSPKGYKYVFRAELEAIDYQLC